MPPNESGRWDLPTPENTSNRIAGLALAFRTITPTAIAFGTGPITRPAAKTFAHAFALALANTFLLSHPRTTTGTLLTRRAFLQAGAIARTFLTRTGSITGALRT